MPEPRRLGGLGAEAAGGAGPGGVEPSGRREILGSHQRAGCDFQGLKCLAKALGLCAGGSGEPQEVSEQVEAPKAG